MFEDEFRKPVFAPPRRQSSSGPSIAASSPDERFLLYTLPKQSSVKAAKLKDEPKLCASKITAKKIEKYFGEVKYNIISEDLPRDIDSDSIITVMLDHLAKDDLLSVSSLEEFKACMKKDVCEGVDELVNSSVNTFTNMLGKIEKTSDPAMSRKDFYITLLESVCDVSKKIFTTKSLTRDSYRSLKMLKDLCQYEIELYGDQLRKTKKVQTDDEKSKGHSIWRDFWCSLLSPILFEDHNIKVDIQLHGRCETSIDIRPEADNSSADTSSDANMMPYLSAPVKISIKPDFAICVQFNEKVHSSQLCVIGEVKTTYYDSEVSPQSDSVSTTKVKKYPEATRFSKRKRQKRSLCSGDDRTVVDELASKKQKTAQSERSELEQHSTTADESGQPGNQGTSGHHGKQPGEQVKKDRLSLIKTQHFMELFGMLRHGIMNPKYRGTLRIFGLYTVMNNAYLTCLTTNAFGKTDPMGSAVFVCGELSSKFHDANETEPKLNFETTVLPALNIFKPAHFKALLTLLKFLSWSESRRMSFM